MKWNNKSGFKLLILFVIIVIVGNNNNHTVFSTNISLTTNESYNTQINTFYSGDQYDFTQFVIFHDNFETQGPVGDNGWDEEKEAINPLNTLNKDAAYDNSLGGLKISSTRDLNQDRCCNQISKILNIDYTFSTLYLDLWWNMVQGKTTLRIELQDNNNRLVALDYNHGANNNWEEDPILDVWSHSSLGEGRWIHIKRNITQDLELGLQLPDSPFQTFEPNKLVSIIFFQDFPGFESNLAYIDNIWLSTKQMSTHFFSSSFEISLTSENGGSDVYTVEWDPIDDSLGHPVTYNLSYFSLEDKEWKLISSNIMTTSYIWKTRELGITLEASNITLILGVSDHQGLTALKIVNFNLNFNLFDFPEIEWIFLTVSAIIVVIFLFWFRKTNKNSIRSVNKCVYCQAPMRSKEGYCQNCGNKN